MSLLKYLYHRQFVFASGLTSILPYEKISSEVWVKVFSDESFIGKVKILLTNLRF